ncbi:MAG: hypothetical protein AAFQ82_10545 [Myxococcota bacterium]
MVDSVDTENAYARNLAAAHFASPEAFSRNRSKPPAILGPGSTGIGAGLRPQPIRSIQRPDATAKPASEPVHKPSPRADVQVQANEPETTLVVRRRKTPPEPTPLGASPTETLVMRERKIPKAAVDDHGDVVPTDHIATLPGAGGAVDPYSETQVSIQARKTQPPVKPTDHIATLPGAGRVDGFAETQIGIDMNDMPNVSVRRALPPEEKATETDGLERVTKSERTEVVRRRRLHPDTVDPESGDVLPTDHVVTAPGLAGLSSSPVERTMPRIDMKAGVVPEPIAHGETVPIERSLDTQGDVQDDGQDPESTMVVRKRKSVEETPESTMVVRKRKTPRGN